MKATVYLDFGIDVLVPHGTDPDSTDGHNLIKKLAMRRLAYLLDDPDRVFVTVACDEDDE